MRLRSLIAGLILATVALVPAGAAGLADASAAGPWPVESIEFGALVDATRSRGVPIKLHAPSGAGPFPVVIVSHGGGGHWDANFAQARHLASHGYMVLALEHVGSNTEVLMRSQRPMESLLAMTRDATEVLGRPLDVRFAIDQAIEWNRSHPQLRGRLRIDRFGVMGHSYGAYTTLVVAGMRPALDWLVPAQGRGMGPDLRDTRVACGVALSPQGPGEPFFTEASYASLQVPMLAMSGSKDAQQGDAPPENRRRAFELWPPGNKFMVWVDGADHLAFSDATGSGRRMLRSPARADVQRPVRAATLMFFESCLRLNDAAGLRLDDAALQPYLRGAVMRAEVVSK